MKKKLTAMQELIVDLDMINAEFKKLDDDPSKVMAMAVKRIQKHIVESKFLKKEEQQISDGYMAGAYCIIGGTGQGSIDSDEAREYYSSKFITEADKPTKTKSDEKSH